MNTFDNNAELRILFCFWGWWINFLNHWMEFAFSGKLYIDVNLKLTHVRIWPEGYVRKGIKQWLLQSREVLGQCGELRGQKIIPVSKKTWNQHFYLERKHFFSFREKELNQKCYQSVLLKVAFNLKLREFHCEQDWLCLSKYNKMFFSANWHFTLKHKMESLSWCFLVHLSTLLLHRTWIPFPCSISSINFTQSFIIFISFLEQLSDSYLCGAHEEIAKHMSHKSKSGSAKLALR